jgi:hypothetical protein
MSFKLLIDECLHPGLVAIAKERGIVADFGPHIGKAGFLRVAAGSGIALE